MDKNKILHATIVMLFLFLSFVINKIPDGTFIAGGDFYQLININDNIIRNLFTWFNQHGQGQYNPLIVAFPFYVFQYILYNLGFSYANIANTIMFLFFVGSFYSFFFAIKIINSKIPGYLKLLCSAIYSINIFTFTIFIFPWWITHHYIIYIFIPLLIAFFEKLLTGCSLKNISYFIIIFLISTSGFNNVAFLAALLFFQVLLSAALFATKKIPLSLITAKRLLFIFILQLILSIFFLLPFFASQFEYISRITGGKVLGDISSVFSWTSNDAYSILSFTMSKDNYPLVNLYSDSKIFLAISLAYIIFIIVAILYQKRKKEKYWLHYLIVILMLLFLLMRGTAPFDKMNIFLYTLPGFNLFRSPDKLFVFYPFFYLVLLSLLLYYSKLSKKIISAMLIFILIIPIPFYIGGIPAYLSHENEKGYKSTIQIPSEYYTIEKIINKDDTQLSIISLPYSVVNSLNWVNYPKWHFVGHDVLHLLYNKYYISANTYDHPALETNLSFKEYNEGNRVDKYKFLKILQKFSGKYILLHKDIEKYWINYSKITYDTINELEADNTIKKLDENEYFALYKLDTNYLIPLMFSDRNKLSFKKFSPVKYDVYIYNLTNKTNIEFHQSYNSQWKLYLKSNPGNSLCKPLEYYKNSNTTECEQTTQLFEISDLSYILQNSVSDGTHKMVNEYANAWTIDPEYIITNYPKEYYKKYPDGSIDIELTLYFKPQSYFYMGLMVSGIAFVICIGYLYKDRKKKTPNKLTTSVSISENLMKKYSTDDWSPSNYPFLIALMLLTVTAVTLAIGDEKLAENLAIYVYYFLALGVAIRFFELSLPEDTLQRLDPAMKLISVVLDFIQYHGLKLIRNMDFMLKNLYSRQQSHLRRAIFEIKISISDFERQHPSIGAQIRKKISIIKLQYLKRLRIVRPGKNISLISDISLNVAILLSVFLIISLAYGVTIDMLFVKRYIGNLILIIIVWLTLYILLRVRVYTGRLK
ncbi:MAG: hypothetical protein FIB07_06475 [Candidatus Methanoperedens sp.]|nr:hypothetical protein [Candidatus Methanoperedens sp.]